MKKIIKILLIITLIIASALLLTACGSKEGEKADKSAKTETLTFDGEEGKITFSVPEGKGYKISTDDEDLRTSREQGSLVGKDFIIGIEFCDDYGYFFESDFEKLKEARSDYDEFEVVTYNGIKAVQYFYGSYNYYSIMFPVANNEDYYLELNVRGPKDTEESAKEAIKNKELLDILNSIKFEAKEAK